MTVKFCMYANVIRYYLRETSSLSGHWLLYWISAERDKPFHSHRVYILDLRLLIHFLCNFNPWVDFFKWRGSNPGLCPCRQVFYHWAAPSIPNQLLLQQKTCLICILALMEGVCLHPSSDDESDFPFSNVELVHLTARTQAVPGMTFNILFQLRFSWIIWDFNSNSQSSYPTLLELCNFSCF